MENKFTMLYPQIFIFKSDFTDKQNFQQEKCFQEVFDEHCAS